MQDLSQSKQTAFRIAWRKLEVLADRPISELTIDEFQSCVSSKAPTHYPAKDMRTLLSHLFKRAVAEGNARANLSEFVRIPRLEEKEAEPFTEEELYALWEAYGNGDSFLGFILLMIYTGMMPGELLKLKKDMIDWEAHEILHCGLKTKKRKQVPIVFPAMVEPVLQDLIATSKSRVGYVVGMNKDTFYDEYHAALARVGIRDSLPTPAATRPLRPSHWAISPPA